SKPPAVTTSVVDKQKEVLVNKVVKEETNSIDEMKRILKSLNHYEALGFIRNKKIDAAILKKEYRKKAMLVHPDKNMGSSLASESFKKLQCAYEVLSDSVKKRDYDEQLRKEESMAKSVCQKSHSSSHQKNSDGTCFLLRIILNIVLKNRDVFNAQSVGIHIFGTAVSFIKQRMEMVGSNIRGLWFSTGLKREQNI
ncbi:chaperone protein dnaJ, partial [Trifolium medium]|nr:chaperone protein dnaJ [Trifolium medium]